MSHRELLLGDCARAWLSVASDDCQLASGRQSASLPSNLSGSSHADDLTARLQRCVRDRGTVELSGLDAHIAFAVYAVGFLAALLTLVSNVIFLAAPDVAWVIVGRVVQGIGTGAATSALTALLVGVAAPNRKKLGTILGSVSVTGGLAFGSLLAGLAIQLTDAANSIVPPSSSS